MLSRPFSEPGRLYASTGHLHYIRAGATGCLLAQQTTGHLSGH